MLTLLLCTQMLQDHLIESTIMTALTSAMNRHPDCPKDAREKARKSLSTKRKTEFAEQNIAPPTQKIESSSSPNGGH